MNRRFILLLPLAATTSCRPQDRGAVRVDRVLVVSTHPDSTDLAGSPGTPLTPADFVVVGLHAEMDSAAVATLLGMPDSDTASDDFRDPGAKLVAWHYRDLTVILGSHNSLGGVAITGPSIATARGLRVGDTRERARVLYGAPESEFGGDWQYEYHGHPALLAALQISFVDGRVREIYLGHLYD
jgi:hypothetical protein